MLERAYRDEVEIKERVWMFSTRNVSESKRNHVTSDFPQDWEFSIEHPGAHIRVLSPPTSACHSEREKLRATSTDESKRNGRGEVKERG